MKNWIRAALKAMFFCLLLPVSAFAGNGQGEDIWYEVFIVWGPIVVLGVLWLYFLSKHSKLRKRSFEHMDRVEELLERIAKAGEQNGK